MIEWLLFKSGFVWISLDTQQEKKRAITLQASVSVERECVFLACSPARRSFGISYSRHTVKTSQSRRRTTVLISHHQRSHRPGPSISPHMCLHSRGLSSNDLNVFFFCFFYYCGRCYLSHAKRLWDTVMYAISGDSDNQDNNYTKPGSSITVTYHLNSQALKRNEGRRGKKGRILDWESPLCVSVRDDPVRRERGVIRVVTWGLITQQPPYLISCLLGLKVSLVESLFRWGNM